MIIYIIYREKSMVMLLHNRTIGLHASWNPYVRFVERKEQLRNADVRDKND